MSTEQHTETEPNLRVTWIVRHDAFPQAQEFTYLTEEEAREAFERSGFYDPSNGWGVTLIRRVSGHQVLATTKPRRVTSAGGAT